MLIILLYLYVRSLLYFKFWINIYWSLYCMCLIYYALECSEEFIFYNRIVPLHGEVEYS